MKLQKHYKSSGTMISAAGLALSAMGIFMAQNLSVSADAVTTNDVDFATTMLFVGGVIIIAGFIVIVLAFFSD